ncbi:FAD:protein FMN transferase [bacterium]|nr:FAD:protein FMN transferase [bacterium]
MNTKCKVAGAVVLGVLLVLFLGCSPSREENVLSEQWIFFDTIVEFKIYGNPDERTADKIFGTVHREFARWDKLLDNYDSTSAIEQLNRVGEDSILVAARLGRFLSECARFQRETGGVLLPNIGHLTKLWGIGTIGTGKKWIPPKEAIDSALALAKGGNFYVVDDTLVVATGDLEIDPGAFAKGYAVDRVYEKIYPLCAGDERIDGFLINAGRNIRGWHRKRKFNIGIRNPRGSGIVGVVQLPPGVACASAGDYERYFIKDGVRYHHIFDPSTGYPARGANASTVIAADALTADALSTAAVIMGKDVKKLVRRPDVEIILFFAKDSSLNYTIIGAERYKVDLGDSD